MPSNPIELANNESLTHQAGAFKDGKQHCARCGKLLSQKPFFTWTEGLLLIERKVNYWTEWKVERRRGDRGSAAPHSTFEG